MFKELDREYLEGIQAEYDVSDEEIIGEIKELGYDLDGAFDVNTWIYIVLNKGANAWLEAVREYCDSNEIDYDVSNFEPNIYCNCIDSSYDSILEEYDITDLSDENIEKFLIEVNAVEEA